MRQASICTALLLFCPLLAIAQHSDAIANSLKDDYAIFSTQNHPKSHDVNLTIAYPKSWTAKESTGSVVQLFQQESQDSIALAQIHIRPIPLPNAEEFTWTDIEEFLFPIEQSHLLPDEAQLLSAQKTELNNLPASVLEYKLRRDAAGTAVDMHSIAYCLIYRDNFIMLQCSVAAPAPAEDTLSQRMREIEPVFRRMANSITFADNWLPRDTPNSNKISAISDSLLHDSTPLFLLKLVISLIITWGLGLAPALVVRYLWLRRPLRKKSANWIAGLSSAFFFLIFLMLHTALGERPGAGSVWILVFFLSRWILLRPESMSADMETKV
ncbi:MAG: hypothetical protein KJ052_03775 [Candidatus Hydrogenedentes bacterium]|nr:hypothetical protein [Candidatus Hydrogenedentota bacterium]